MLNATYTDPDVEVVDVDNGVPSIILQELIKFITLLILLMVVLHIDQLIAVSIDVIVYLYISNLLIYIYLYTSDKRDTLLREVSAMVDSHKSSSFS